MVSEILPDDMILDLGAESCIQVQDIIKQAGTIVWNGPIGVFEFEPFALGTKTLAQAIAQSSGFSMATLTVRSLPVSI